MKKKVFGFFVFLVSMLMVFCACQAPTQQNNENAQSSLEENSHTANPSASDESKDDGATFLDWKTAYLDFIESRESEYGKESAYGFDFRYALVYVDNDDIPELYAMGTCEADGDLICSYKNGRVIEQRLARMFGGKYIERSGIVINQNGHTGQYYNSVYKLDKNGFSKILNATYTERYVTIENDEFETINEYFIDGKSVSKDEYDAAINASVDLSQTKEFYENSVSYDKIKQQISDCK